MIKGFSKELRLAGKEYETVWSGVKDGTPVKNRSVPSKTVDGTPAPDLQQTVPTNDRQPNLLDDVRPSGKEGNTGAKVEDINSPNGGEKPGAAGGKATNVATNNITSQLTRAQSRNIKTLKNIMDNNLTESDFSGTLADLQGNPIANKAGGYWDHLTEMKQSYQALKNIQISLEGSLMNKNLSVEVREYLSENLRITDVYIARIEALFEPFGGISK